MVAVPHRANGSDEDGQAFEVGVTDSRRAMAYLVAPGSDDYIRIMAVLESSVTDLTPAEIAALVSAGGPVMSEALVQARLDKLKAGEPPRAGYCVNATTVAGPSLRDCGRWTPATHTTASTPMC